MGIIYQATNTVNGMLYIGKTVSTLITRARQHYSDTKRGSKTYFHNAIRRYGNAAFEWQVLVTAENTQLFDLERLFIQEALVQGYELYNLTVGGEGALGNVQSEATRQKKRIALLGNKNSLGYKHTADTKARWSQQRLGIKNPNVGVSNVRRSKTYNVLSPNGLLVEITNMAEFCRINNLNKSAMSEVVRGIRKSHKGWVSVERSL